MLCRRGLESFRGTVDWAQHADDCPSLECPSRCELFQSCDWTWIPDFCRKWTHETWHPVRHAGNHDQRSLEPRTDLQVRFRGSGGGDVGVSDCCIKLLCCSISPPHWLLGFSSSARELFEADLLFRSGNGHTIVDWSHERSFVVRTSQDGSRLWIVLCHRNSVQRFF